MRFLNKALAPLVFWIAYTLFRSKLNQQSEKKHTFVMKLFRFAADNGHMRALSVYGHLLHFRGEGVDNRIQGGIYLQRAAEQGDVKAAYQMGRIFEEGFESYFQPNQEKALAYYQQAAASEHHLAMVRMIKVFAQGELGQKIDQGQEQFWQEKLAQREFA